MTSSGIEPATLQLVAQSLNKLRYHVAPRETYRHKFNNNE
jgi:hypothetical protein